MGVITVLLRTKDERKLNTITGSSKQHADGNNQLARYDFLLIFYSNFRSRWNYCQVISCQSQQTEIPHNN